MTNPKNRANLKRIQVQLCWSWEWKQRPQDTGSLLPVQRRAVPLTSFWILQLCWGKNPHTNTKAPLGQRQQRSWGRGGTGREEEESQKAEVRFVSMETLTGRMQENIHQTVPSFQRFSEWCEQDDYLRSAEWWKSVYPSISWVMTSSSRSSSPGEALTGSPSHVASPVPSQIWIMLEPLPQSEHLPIPSASWIPNFAKLRTTKLPLRSLLLCQVELKTAHRLKNYCS